MLRSFRPIRYFTTVNSDWRGLMAKEKCGDEFDGSLCLKEKEHHGKHIDGVGSKNGPLSWTDAGKARVLAERAEAQSVEVKQ